MPLAIGIGISEIFGGAGEDTLVSNNLELETGDNALLETGDFILLEN